MINDWKNRFTRTTSSPYSQKLSPTYVRVRKDQLPGPVTSIKPTMLGLCCKCGGKPYTYDLRGTDTHELCTVECGSCDYTVEANTPEEAATKWSLT